MRQFTTAFVPKHQTSIRFNDFGGFLKQEVSGQAAQSAPIATIRKSVSSGNPGLTGTDRYGARLGGLTLGETNLEDAIANLSGSRLKIDLT